MEKETLKEKTAKGLFWGALNNGTMQLLNIVIGIFLARLLTPSDYGLVGMLAVFTAIAGALQESGFTTALANMEHPTDNDYNSVFWFSAIMGWVSYSVLFFSAPLIANFFHHTELINLSRFLFASLLFSSLGTVPAAYLFKNMMVKETALLRITSLIISGVVGIVLALKGYAYWSLAWQQLLYITLTSLWRFFIIPWRPSFHIDFKPVKRMFPFSYKILVTTIINTISQNILTFIFGRLYSAKVVGNFSQAFKWDTMASTFVSGTVSQVAQPVLVEVNNDLKRQVNVFRKGIVFMVSIYTVITVLWLGVWQFFAHKEIGIRLIDILKDICPYLLTSVAVMISTYLITLWIQSLLLLLLTRVVLAALLYYIVMKMGGSQTLKECLNYFHRKRR